MLMINVEINMNIDDNSGKTEIFISLENNLLDKIATISESNHVSVENYISNVLTEHLNNPGKLFAQREKSTPNMPGIFGKQRRQQFEQLVEEYRIIVNDCVEKSVSWEQLISRLSFHNLLLSPKYKGLVLKTINDDKEVCSASSIGISYTQLILKFKSGFPNHPYPDIARRALSNNRNKTNKSDLLSLLNSSKEKIEHTSLTYIPPFDACNSFISLIDDKSNTTECYEIGEITLNDEIINSKSYNVASVDEIQDIVESKCDVSASYDFKLEILEGNIPDIPKF